MPTQSLTAKFLTNIHAQTPLTGIVKYFDDQIKGFFLEHRAGGGATYYFRYRDSDRKVRQVRLGRVNDISLPDARSKAQEFKMIVKEGREVPRLLDPGRTMTYETFVLSHYLPFVRTRKRSWQTDEGLLRNHLIPRFGKLRLNCISQAEIIRMQTEGCLAGYAAGTLNRWLVLLRYTLNCAIRWEILTGQNPTKGIASLRDDALRERFLSEPEVKTLYEELARNPNRQVCDVVKLLLLTGARKREILNARWECVDLQRRILTVPLSKSGKPRHITLSDAAIQLLKELPRDGAIPWVFFNAKTGKPPTSIFFAWNTIRKRAGLRELRLHDLRHSFASFLVNKGRSLYEVQRLLGHSNAKTTMRYAHLAPQALIDATNVLGTLVSETVHSSGS